MSKFTLRISSFLLAVLVMAVSGLFGLAQHAVAAPSSNTILDQIPFNKAVGNALEREDCEGKAIIISLGRYNCGNCASLAKNMEEFIGSFGLSEDVVFLAFDLDQPVSAVEDYASSTNYQYVSIYKADWNWAWSLQEKYNVEFGGTTPLVYLFDKNGNLYKTSWGSQLTPDIAADLLAITGKNCSFNIADGVLKKYYGNGGDITVPSNVTEIATGTFEFYADDFEAIIKSVTIYPSVNYISNEAFRVKTPIVDKPGWYSITNFINFTIIGQSGSFAESFAQNYKINFEPFPIAIPTQSKVVVNGKDVSFDAYNIKDNNYFKLRDIAYILSGTQKQFDVTWDGNANAIRLEAGKPYTVVGGEMQGMGVGNKNTLPTNSIIYLAGKEVKLTAYNIQDNNYFKLRDIGIAFDFDVTWDEANNTIVVDTSKSYSSD